MTADQIIEQLALEAHPEGGYFRRTYTAPINCADGQDRRAAMSSIFYLLTTESPIGRLHSNRSDIIHYWQGGAALRYVLLSPEGEFEEKIMGPDLAAGQLLQMTVEGGWWKASELLGADADFGLISEAVCPGFDYADHRFAGAKDIEILADKHWSVLKRFC